MPHVVPKTKATASPWDVDGPLGSLAVARVNLLGVSGSHVEFEGELTLLVKDEDLETVRATLDPATTRYLDEADGQHLDYVVHAVGNLLQAVRRGRRHHPGGVVNDIVVGVEPMTFSIYAHDDEQLGVRAGDVVRDASGHPIADQGQEQVKALPVQIHFVVPVERDADGAAIEPEG
jgi:hypothetical protein